MSFATPPKPYLAVPIQDCGEPLAPINLEGVKLIHPHPYQKLGTDYQGRSPYMLRTGVLKRLDQARLTLADIEPTWQILVFDAYRPIAIQQFMVEYTFAEIVARDGLQGQSLTPEQRENIYQQVYQIWAIPSDNPLTPPPHSTGAALDITLLDQSGEPVDMGGEIDELSPRSHPNYYQTAQPESDVEKEQFQLYQQRRELLNIIMESAGFLRHPGEWWHFSQGDQLWAWQYNQQHPDRQKIAYYGRVE
ncbi:MULTISPECIES: M15 family metallopeptidase [unclassified Synechocystis]|uniref:M15 family metallopeptidase n=1 Tax=unclassified Synechocystis TaxID=2640012 RepID=UPI0004138861|nr:MULTISPECIES: M15 family metallopeptidase [unclassified Synechocystis]AIE74968.1 D-alanyl-D-alanine dipeptidase [Synechocystis sp. PCC 6714]MCT0253322.1 D-alanyl-D-alanine dipeptidase [Synechocystis sp. CS-94]